MELNTNSQSPTDRHRLAVGKYYSNNRASILEQKRRYYTQNKTTMNQKSKDYYLSNAETLREKRRQRYRATKEAKLAEMTPP